MKAPREIFIYEFNYVEGSHLGQYWHDVPSKEGNKSHKYINAQDMVDFARKKCMDSEETGDFILGYICAMADLIEMVR